MVTTRPNPDRRAPESWHLDKKVPLSLIFAMLVQGVVVIGVIADIKKDVEVLKAAQFEQRFRDDRQDKTTADAVLQVRQEVLQARQDIKELGQKMDRLIERKTK